MRTKGYKNVSKTSVEPEWFINTQIHVYIAWFGHMHAHHLVGVHDHHLGYMQACH